MKVLKYINLFLLLVLIFSSSLMSQERKHYEGPLDGAGDKAVERIGLMEGNNIRLQFRNTTELSDWGPGTDPFASKWPNDFRGSKMNDGVGLLIGARVFIEKDPNFKVDSMGVDEIGQIEAMHAQGMLDTLYYLQTSYREEMDTNEAGDIWWALYPVRGYMNNIPNVPPAVSNRPDSWPPDGWPSRGREKKWPGEWNGRFGRGVFKADLECYFVANDAQDQEYLADTSLVKYYPKPGVNIGDIDPQVSIQRGLPWGGIGVRVEQRGFQWTNPAARDAIFWEYTISNTTDYHLQQVGFGYWVDNAIGDDGNDELAAFDTILDLAYSWDVNGIGGGGLKVGTMGFAYLESPAKHDDMIDNDEDGLIDEKRDNKADGQTPEDPRTTINNLDAFLNFYKLEEKDLPALHFRADEDADWDDGVDANGNGVYDIDENPGDDIGLDGVAPGDLNYEGPDADGTECNHQPDLLEGYGSEPDFGLVDVSESDMLGLTSFRLFPVPASVPPMTNWFINDESMWYLIGADSLVPYIGQVANLIEVFATGVFPLYAGHTERISMSQLHSWDDGVNIKAGDPVVNPPLSLFRLKDIVQVIYETDYRFAQPPLMPTLQATPGDGYVLLTWDNVSETKTRESFSNNENDFEGYRIYKATDRNFTDAALVTNAVGDQTGYKALFQCDKVDNIKGFTEFGITSTGTSYYLGNDTGLFHSYRDDNVQNGRTYYYVLVAYDYGLEDIGVPPSENNWVIEVNEVEEITFKSKNVQVVRPRPKAAGFETVTDITVEGQENVLGSGSIEPQLVARGALKPNNRYKVKFSVDPVKTVTKMDWGMKWVNDGIYIYDATDGSALVYSETPDNPGAMLIDSTETLRYWFITPGGTTTDIFDGITLDVNIPVIEPEYDVINSGWLKGTSPINVTPTAVQSAWFPWEYNIVFTNNDSAYVSEMRVSKTTRIYDEDDVRLRENLLAYQAFNFYVQNNSIMDPETGEPRIMEMVVQDMPDADGNFDGVFNILQDRVLVGAPDDFGRWAGTVFVIDFFNLQDESELPQPDDVYKVTFVRPFWKTDSLFFSVNSIDQVDKTKIKDSLEKIKVVPNPYVATNTLEPALANPDFNQRRRIMFTHVPARCTIKIFTVSGVFIDQVDVENDGDDGIAYWDLLTKDGLELAAGVYLWHIKAEDTGDEKLGKFAVIK